jgi:hypothetical protein
MDVTVGSCGGGRRFFLSFGVSEFRRGGKNGKPEFFFASFLGILAADDFLSCFSYLLFPFQLYPQPRGVSEEEAGRDF